MKFRTIFTFLFLMAAGNVAAQKKNTTATKDNFQIWEFMTRHTFTMKSIAQRFQVDEKIIKKLSKYRKKKVYPGRILRVPVLVRLPVWNPEEVNPNQAILGEEDSRPLYEFEWNTDSLDPFLKEDFIILREVQADSIQLEKISYHISRIDRYITRANKRLDSIKREEFAFDYDEEDLNSVLQRMQEARQRYYKASPIGKEVDSLTFVKSNLGEESNRLQIRIDEYDFLHENTTYFQRTKGGDREKPNDWDMRIEAEERYLSRKQKHRIDVTALKTDERKIIETKPQAQNTAVNNDMSAASTKTTAAQAANAANNQSQAAQTQTAVSAQTPTAQNDPILNSAKSAGSEVKAAQNTTVASAETETKKTKEKTETQNVKADEKTKTVKQKDPKQATAEKDKEKTVQTKEADLDKEKAGKAKAATDKTTDNSTAVVSNNRTTEQEEQEEKTNETVIKTQSQQTTVINADEQVNYIPVQSVKQDVKPSLSANDVLAANQLGKQSVSAIQSDAVSSSEVGTVNASSAKKEEEEDPLDKYELLVSVYPNVSISPLPVAMAKDRPQYTITPDSATIKKANVYIERFKEEMKNENVNKAENMLKRAIDINPNNATAWCYHAELQVLTGHVHEAAREYVIAQTIQPENPRPFYKMGVLYDLSNNTSSAHEYYTRAMRADNTFTKAYIARATLALKQGDIPAAISDYGLLVEANPSYVEGYKTRGLLKMKVREYESAVQDFSTYIENADPEGEAPYWRGMAKVFLGNTISGCEDFQAALNFKYELAAQAVKKFCE